MARKKEPCDFCREEFFNIDEITNQLQLSIEVYPDNNQIGISVVGSIDEKECEILNTIEMNYCPVCGRKLI